MWIRDVSIAIVAMLLAACAPLSQNLRIAGAPPGNSSGRQDDTKAVPAPVEATPGEGAEFRLLRQRDDSGAIAPDALSRALRQRQALLQSPGNPLRMAPEAAGVRRSGW